MSQEPTPPIGHPKSIRWVGLLHAKSRSFEWRGRRFEIRAPDRLKKSDWRYGAPVPKSLALELVRETTHIEPMPNSRGEVRSSVLRTVPLYELLPAPPDWRGKLRERGDLVQFADTQEAEVSEPITGAGADPAHIDQLVREATERNSLERWRQLIDAGVVDADAVRAAVEKGLAPGSALELIPEGDEEADRIAAMGARDVVAEILATTDPNMLSRIWSAENRRVGGPRVTVGKAHAVQEKALKILTAAPARPPAGTDEDGDGALPPALEP